MIPIKTRYEENRFKNIKLENPTYEKYCLEVQKIWPDHEINGIEYYDDN